MDLKGYLIETRIRILSLVEQLGQADAEASPAEGSWSIHAILEHLAENVQCTSACDVVHDITRLF